MNKLKMLCLMTVSCQTLAASAITVVKPVVEQEQGQQRGVTKVTKKTVNTLKKSPVSVDKLQAPSTQHLILTVTQVETVADYAEVMAYLKSVAGVTQINMLRAQPALVTFELSIVGEKSALENILIADKKMRPVVEKQKTILDNTQLIYEWSP